MSGAANGKTDRVAFLDWITNLARMEYPTNPQHVAALKAGAVTSDLKWLNFRMFLVYVFSEHGTYGRNVYPAQDTMSADYRINRRTVSKWLNAAEAVGLVAKVADASRIRGAEYRINSYDPMATAGVQAPVVAPVGVGNFDDDAPY